MDKEAYLRNDGFYAENDRLLLRLATQADKDDYMKLHIQIAVLKEMFKNEEYYEFYWSRYFQDEDLELAIIDKETQHFVGTVMLMHLDSERQEIGINILEEYRRQHYAHDAIALLMQHAYKVTGKNTFVVKIYEDNAASHKLFEGFDIIATDDEESAFTRFLEISKEQFGEEHVKKLMKDAPFDTTGLKERKVDVYLLKVTDET